MRKFEYIGPDTDPGGGGTSYFTMKTAHSLLFAVYILTSYQSTKEAVILFHYC